MKDSERFIKIKNGGVEVVVDRVGAQIVSMTVNGLEVMFQGAIDSMTGEITQWGKTAPVLFPNPGPVGKVSDAYGELKQEGKQTVYYHNGGVYRMGQHGFAQTAEFQVQGLTDHSCVLSFDADQETVKSYPYDFRFYVVLDIDEKGKLEYKSAVNNLDNKPILAGQGWHPAFALHGDIDEYAIVFENLVKDESGTCTVEEGTMYPISEKYIKGNKSEKFEGIKSADVSLVYRDRRTGRYVTYLTMHTENPNFVVWSRDAVVDDKKTGKYFIALEPWNTTPRQIQKLTTQDKTKDIEGARIVEEGQVDELNSTVKVNPEYIALFEHQKEDDEGIVK